MKMHKVHKNFLDELHEATQARGWVDAHQHLHGHFDVDRGFGFDDVGRPTTSEWTAWGGGRGFARWRCLFSRRDVTCEGKCEHGG
jgi:hypothetical protein